jgi:lipopolysaccharide heptosyltransferase II
MTAPDFRRLHRILLSRPDNIGDVVMLGPAIRELRRAYPTAQLTLLTSPAGARVADGLPWLDDVIVERVLWQDVSGVLPFEPRQQQLLVDKLAARAFDAAFIFTSFRQSPYPSAYICYLAGIPLRAGHSKEFGGGVLSHWFPSPPDEMHQTERNLRLIELCGIPVSDRGLELPVPASVEASVDRLLESAGLASGQPFIALAPGASCRARRYPADRFGRVASLLATNTCLPVVVLGSETERETLAQAAPPGTTGFMGRTSVLEFGAVIARASLVIANNSSALHFADAFGRPLVLTYSGTDYEEQWRPRRSPSRILRRPTDCSPCYAFECPFNLECLDIEPQEVVDAATGLLMAEGVEVQ